MIRSAGGSTSRPGRGSVQVPASSHQGVHVRIVKREEPRRTRRLRIVRSPATGAGPAPTQQTAGTSEFFHYVHCAHELQTNYQEEITGRAFLGEGSQDGLLLGMDRCSQRERIRTVLGCRSWHCGDGSSYVVAVSTWGRCRGHGSTSLRQQGVCAARSPLRGRCGRQHPRRARTGAVPYRDQAPQRQTHQRTGTGDQTEVPGW